MKHLHGVCLVGALLTPSVASARAEPTSAVVAVSGSRRVLTLNGEGEPQAIGGRVYIGREAIEITPLVPGVDVVVYVRGVPELDLFEDDGSPASQERCVAKTTQSLVLTKLAQATRIGYRYCIPVHAFVKEQGSLSVVSGNRDPETILLDFEPAKGILQSPAGTTIMSVVLVALGAIVGLVTSTIQQRLAIASQHRATFWQKMMEKEDELSEFFRDYLDRLRKPVGSDDQAEARRVRRLLSKQGAYAIMPPGDIRRLNRICDGPWTRLRGSRLDCLDRLIRKTFSEVMRQP
jgi:hypothetical protein